MHCVWVRQSVCGSGGGDVEMSSVCRLQLHRTSQSVPVKQLFIHQPRLDVRPWHREVVRKPSGDRLPVALPCPLQPAFALHPFSESSLCAKAVYLSVSPWQFTLGDGHWRFGSVLSDGAGWIPIKGLSFHRSFIKQHPLSGQESCAPGRFPWGLEES